MNASLVTDTPFRDRLDRLVFRGDRVRNRRTNLEYVVNNVINGEWIDGVRFDQGARLMCAMCRADTELIP